MEIETTEMHTGGEPLRIITSGFPVAEGKTYLERWRNTKKEFESIRTRLMLEPRGHNDQYGAILTEPDHEDADIGVWFIHNEGYSTMCGHAVIALGRYVVDNDLHKKKTVTDTDDGGKCVETNIQCPCGLVRAEVQLLKQSESGVETGSVSFTSVPAFLFIKDIIVNTPTFGILRINISYGGAFYVIIEAGALGLDLKKTPLNQLVEAADEITKTVAKGIPVTHPEVPDLSFLYGTILTDGEDEFCEEPTANLCVFAEKEVDRSPTGSGVTARCALQYAKGFLKVGQERKFENSKTGSTFQAKIVEELKYGKYKAVRVKVKGEAFYTGTCKFTMEERDPFKDGFRIS